MSIRTILAPRHAAAILAVSLALAYPKRVAGDGMFRLQGHVKSRSIHRAQYLGPHDAHESMRLAVVLKVRDQAALDDFLRRLQDPRDPEYRRYLTPSEFAARFGASDEDLRDLADHFARYGLRVSRVHENRLVLDVEGPVASVEDAFQLQMHDYRLENGRVAHAANADPIFPAALAGRVGTVAGLDNFAERRPHLAAARALPNSGTGSVGDFMTPAKIASGYSLPAGVNGSGETLALFELDGYNASDISAYASYFSITAPTLQNVLVDGATGAPGRAALEVTLDIELAAAVAPGLSKIMVYEGPNTDQGVLDTYSKIAADNIAKEVSSSWGAPEGEQSQSFLNAENTLFQQMAAQGQSIFVASGDNGAYDDGSHLGVDDPASQPYVTAVGGTSLTLNPENTYRAETSWGNSSNKSGGGGGVSTVWPLPAWQLPVSTNANGESTTHRMVPDVSLDSDPNTGYPVYMVQSDPAHPWLLVGGTSCAAPMWAAYMALVNQKRVASGLARVGFANPALYQVAESAQGPTSYHDIADGTTNLYYSATIDYDLATGWGSFIGQGLFNNLTAAAYPAALAAPGTPTNFSVRAQ